MKKDSIFKIILIIIPFLFFLIIELVLRIFSYGDDLDIFVSHPTLQHHYFINPDLGKRYFPSKTIQPKVSVDLLLKDKPANGYRIFAFGGSSAAGYPYYYNATFTKMLKDRLDDALPGLEIELVNLSMPAVNSHTILDLVKGVIPYQPDAFIIYAGHNEFYGALGSASNEQLSKHRWLVKLYLSLQHSKTFQILQDFIHYIRLQFSVQTDKETIKQKTLMERMVGNKKIIYHSVEYSQTLETFRENLNEIVEIASENKIQLIMSELVSNIKDQSPFISIPKPDSLNAETHYKLAKEFELKRKIKKAKEEFYKAKDFDGLRFRASEDFNKIIREVSKKFDIGFVPMVTVFEDHSPDQLIGNNLMLDHLHPNLKGTFLMAKAFSDVIKENNFIPSQWNRKNINTDSIYWNKTGVTDLDEAVGDLRIKILFAGWPFQKESKVDNFIRNYKPNNRVNIIALDIWNKDVTWEKGHLAMAKYYESNKNFKKAEKEYIALIKARPFDPAFYNKLSKIYFMQNQATRAEEILKKSIVESPTNFAYRMLGAIYIKKDDIDSGIDLLTKALQLNPNDSQSLYNLAGAYALKTEYSKSKKILNRLLKLDPNHQGGINLFNQIRNNQ